ncbi:hypothetical protein GF359_00515 [candidate division WOR-3 bacterium]|uniref:FlgD/Vpr Ig-like domain-containing protein n=1 Tax=candidate division WOR-3 bacterium TaxID=2052148 RepID=A0A9D5QD35_UNCW3|nr:hypothetical protein [candidate division WOR-3 bacterium]MBD3363675.1 hypothetical protein [candidate division WOR-3 bacterium]
MFLFVLSLITSFEFPVCTAPGDQVYPDVCWDGEAFWVVWADEELGTIRGVRVNEEGELLTDEIELINSGTDPGPVSYPSIGAGPDRFAVNARVMVRYNEFGTEIWGVMHQEFSLDGQSQHDEPIRIPESFELEDRVSIPLVIYGKDHFFSFYKAGIETPADVHMSSYAVGINSQEWEPVLVWRSSYLSLEYEPPAACWTGDSFMVIFNRSPNDRGGLAGLFLPDTLIDWGNGYSFEYLVDGFTLSAYYRQEKHLSLSSDGSFSYLVGECPYYLVSGQIGFYMIDSLGSPKFDSASYKDFNDNILCFHPDMVYESKKYIAVWENFFETNNTSHLYAIEVDTVGEVLKTGYVVQKSPVDKHPAIAFGSDQYLLVWTDNQDGDFNIHGKLFDTLEVFEGIEEQPLPVNELPSIALETNPNPFSKKTTIRLPKGLQLETNTVINIYDNTGSQVQQLIIPTGQSAVTWDGTDSKGQALSSGIYFIRPGALELKTTKIIKQ